MRDLLLIPALPLQTEGSEKIADRFSVGTQIDATDSQVVSGSDEAWLDLQGSCVGLHSFLTAVSVRQRCPETVP